MIRYLDIVDPKRRFRARGKSELSPKDIKAILVSYRAVLLKCRRPFPPRMQFLPFTVGWEKKTEERVNNTRRLVIPKRFSYTPDGLLCKGRKRDLCSLAFPLPRVIIRANRDEVARCLPEPHFVQPTRTLFILTRVLTIPSVPLFSSQHLPTSFHSTTNPCFPDSIFVEEGGIGTARWEN